MGKPDALSRQSEFQNKKQKPFIQLLPTECLGDYSLVGTQAICSAVSVLNTRESVLAEIAKHTYTSELWNDIVLNSNTTDRPGFKIYNGLIYKGDRIWVPNVTSCNSKVILNSRMNLSLHQCFLNCFIIVIFYGLNKTFFCYWKKVIN